MEPTEPTEPTEAEILAAWLAENPEKHLAACDAAAIEAPEPPESTRELLTWGRERQTREQEAKSALASDFANFLDNLLNAN